MNSTQLNTVTNSSALGDNVTLTNVNPNSALITSVNNNDITTTSSQIALNDSLSGNVQEVIGYEYLMFVRPIYGENSSENTNNSLSLTHNNSSDIVSDITSDSSNNLELIMNPVCSVSEQNLSAMHSSCDFYYDIMVSRAIRMITNNNLNVTACNDTTNFVLEHSYITLTNTGMNAYLQSFSVILFLVVSGFTIYLGNSVRYRTLKPVYQNITLSASISHGDRDIHMLDAEPTSSMEEENGSDRDDPRPISDDSSIESAPFDNGISKDLGEQWRLINDLGETETPQEWSSRNPVSVPYYDNQNVKILVRAVYLSGIRHEDAGGARVKIKDFIKRMGHTFDGRKARSNTFDITTISDSRITINSDDLDIKPWGKILVKSLRGLYQKWISLGEVKSIEATTSAMVASMLNIYFQGRWSIHPEARQHNNKIPDHLVSGRFRGELYPKIFVEVKRLEGDNFVKIQDQISSSIFEVFGQKGEYSNEADSFIGSNQFVIAVRGFEIAFFEKITPCDFLKDTPHTGGIIPLALRSNELSTNSVLNALQDRIASVTDKPKGKGHAFKFTTNLHNTKAINSAKFSVLDITKDYQLVHDILTYMSTYYARGPR